MDSCHIFLLSDPALLHDKPCHLSTASETFIRNRLGLKKYASFSNVCNTLLVISISIFPTVLPPSLSRFIYSCRNTLHTKHLGNYSNSCGEQQGLEVLAGLQCTKSAPPANTISTCIISLQSASRPRAPYGTSPPGPAAFLPGPNSRRALLPFSRGGHSRQEHTPQREESAAVPLRKTAAHGAGGGRGGEIRSRSLWFKSSNNGMERGTHYIRGADHRNTCTSNDKT